MKKNQIVIMLLVGYCGFFNSSLYAQSMKTLDSLIIYYFDKADYDSALLIAEKAKVQAESEFGKNDTNYANVLNNFGAIYYSLGDYSKAESYFNDALSIKKNILGERHPNYAQSLRNLGELYKNLGDYTKAETLFIKVNEIYKEYFGENNLEYSKSLRSLGGLYSKTGDYTKAEPLLLKELEILKNLLGDKNTEYASSVNGLALLYNRMGNNTQAEAYYIQAINLRKEILGEKHPDYATSIGNLGLLYKETDRFSEAEPLLIQSKDIIKESLGINHPDYLITLTNLGTLYLEMGNYEKAEPLLLEAKNGGKEILGEKNPTYATYINNIECLYSELGAYSKSEPLCLEALKIRKEALGEKSMDYTYSLNNAGALYYKMGYYAKALFFFLKVKDNLKKILGDKHNTYASILSNLGTLYETMGNNDEAEQCLLQALSIKNTTSGDQSIDYSTSLNNLATFYFTIGDYTKAELYFIQALNIRKNKLGEKNLKYATSLHNLGVLYSEMGQMDKAEKMFTEAAGIRKEISGVLNDDYATTLNSIAKIYQARGKSSLTKDMQLEDFSKAEKMFLESLNIRKEKLGVKNTGYALSLNNLAALYVNIGNSVSIKDSSLPNYIKAESLYVEAKNIYRDVLGEKNSNYAIVLNNLALLYQSMCRYKDAFLSFSEFLKIQYYNIQNNFSFMSGIEKEKYLETLKKDFNNYNAFVSKAYKETPEITKEDYNYYLVIKGILLNSSIQMQDNITGSGDTLLIRMYKDWMDQKLWIANLQQMSSSKIRKMGYNIDSLENVTNTIEKELSKKSSFFAKERESQQLFWEDIQKNLKITDAAIEIANYKTAPINKFDENGNHIKGEDTSMYYALIIRPGYSQPEMKFLFEQKQLDSVLNLAAGDDKQITNQLYAGNEINVNNSEKGKYLASKLYELIWKPIEPLMNGVSTIYYSPSGLLHKISFAALYTPDNMYLSDKYNLVQLSSTREIIKIKTQKDYITQADSALVFGGINYNQMYAKEDTAENKNMLAFSRGIQIPDDSSRTAIWGYLKGSMKEAQYIDSLFRKNKVVTAFYSDSNATEGLFKNISGKAPRIIHISTHGFFFPDPVKKDMVAEIGQQTFVFSENPLLRTGLILAGGNNVWAGEEPVMGKDDGILTAYEVSNMDLSNTKLLVLSACQTGLGDIKGNEGVFGLQRAFKMAGVDYIIMSLWSVPDKETTEFMQLFYTNCTKKQTIREAFTNAQAKMRKKYDPYYWAAFALME
ncbi:MAG TPA: CHAT domain-containing protein [Bacteroidales bacterium]|nr:CHAT domain-containing protein [Bacteroidales bacterium]